jgi:hypothetical protein
MNENPSNPPDSGKKSWLSPGRILLWLLVAVISFIVCCAIALVTGENTRNPEWLILSLAVSLVLTVVLLVGLVFVRWISSWRNFRRALFAIACVFTLIVLFFAVEGWRGRHLWLKHRSGLEAKGEKFTLEALAPPAVPDEKNFAMTPLLKPMLDFAEGPSRTIWRDTNAMARLEKLSADLSPDRESNNRLVVGNLEKGTYANLPACAEFYRGNTNYPQALEGAKPAEVILTALAKFDPEIQELREASVSRPDCRFPIAYRYEPPWNILLPHLARIKGLMRLTQVRALGELEANQPAEAFADLKTGFRLSDSIREEPLLIDHLVRVAGLNITLQTVREGLVRHAWTDAQLAELGSYLGTLNVLAEGQRAMRGERACSTSGLDFMRRQGFRAEPMNWMSERGSRSLGSRLMPSGWLYRNMLNISRFFEEHTLPTVDETERRVFPDRARDGEQALTQMRTTPYSIFAKMLLPALQKAVIKSARTQTYTDAAQAGCALERYRLASGHFPERLDELVPRYLERIPNDVMDGKPLRYRVGTDGGYRLYSVGWNQKDDEGQIGLVRQKKGSSVDASQGDWVWHMGGNLALSEVE